MRKDLSSSVIIFAACLWLSATAQAQVTNPVTIPLQIPPGTYSNGQVCINVSDVNELGLQITLTSVPGTDGTFMLGWVYSADGSLNAWDTTPYEWTVGPLNGTNPVTFVTNLDVHGVGLVGFTNQINGSAPPVTNVIKALAKAPKVKMLPASN